MNSIKGDLIIDGRHIEKSNILKNIVRVDGDLIIRNNPPIAFIKSLDNIEYIGGNLKISKNKTLCEINDKYVIFKKLRVIKLGLYFYFNENNHDFDYFPLLESIGGTLCIRDNKWLYSIGDFPCLQSVHDVMICNNNHLRIITEFPKLKSVHNFSVYDNKRLKHIEFPKLKKVNGDFLVYNKKLVEVNFDSLELVKGNFRINHTSNFKLTPFKIPLLKK